MVRETVSIWLANAQKTQEFGRSLANTLYAFPLTILLKGELGAGKTTLLQGFAEGLGIEGPISSPTFALEQRYALPKGGEFLHLDLYRLDEAHAKALLLSTEDFEGIRCIEWAERVPSTEWSGPLVRITLSEDGDSRRAEVVFEDVDFPTEEQIHTWRKDVLLPSPIIAHCEVVANVCDTLSDALIQKGIAVRPLALRRAAQLHDLLRFIDFKEQAAPLGSVKTVEEKAHWETLRSVYPPSHEEACVQFLNVQGFPEIATMIRTHGSKVDGKDREHTEEHLLFYADKRVMVDRVVSIEERLQDFANRYGNGAPLPPSNPWLTETKAVEDLLFPEGVPL